MPIIGRNVLIGARCTILGGCRIGDNVVIGANTYVDKDVPDNQVIFERKVYRSNVGKLNNEKR